MLRALYDGDTEYRCHRTSAGLDSTSIPHMTSSEQHQNENSKWRKCENDDDLCFREKSVICPLPEGGICTMVPEPDDT